MPISPYTKRRGTSYFAPSPSGGTRSTLGGVSTSTQTSTQAQERTLLTDVGIDSISGSYATPTASLTASQLLRAGAASALSVRSPFRGSIVGLAITGSANKTAGTATFEVYVNGVASGAKLDWPSSASSASVMFNMSDFGFNAGDRLDVRVTTSSTYAPISTVVEATIFVALDQSEAI